MLDISVLYAEHRLTLVGWVRRHAPWWLGEDDIDDMVQTVFERAWKAHARYQDRGQPPLAWLTRIARNLLLDMQRQRQRYGVRYVALDDATSVEGMSSDLSVTLDLHAAIARLTPRQRSVIAWRYGRDAQWRTVGDETGLGLDAVKDLHKRALGTLRRTLEAG